MDIKEHLQKFMAQQTGLSVTPLLEQGLVAAIGPGGMWALTEAGHVLLNGEDDYATTSFAKEQTAQQELLNAQARAALEADWASDFLTKFKASNPASSQQVGGGHYKDFPIQPVEFIEKNNLSFLEGCVVKRICRYDQKNAGEDGVEDLRKAIHEIRLLMELRYGVSE